MIGVETESGMIAAFDGNECRGVAPVSAFGSSQLLIHGRTSGEVITLKFYEEATMRLFTITDAVRM